MTTAMQQPTMRQTNMEQTQPYGGNGQQHAAPNAERLARGLGWFSIGLGLAEIAVPHRLARLIGINDDDRTRKAMFALGLREITSGMGILTQSRPAGWVWTRVAGDMMDLALLGSALKSDDSDRDKVATATAATVGVTILDIIAGQQLSHAHDGATERESSDSASPAHAAAQKPKDGKIHVTKLITINRSPEEVYSFWHNFENLPRFMAHLESVQISGERRSHWKAKAPAGRSVEWDAEIVEDRPNELIAWRSLKDADVPNSGSVRFTSAPGGRGTEIRVELRYDPPGGALSAAIAKLFGEEPGEQVYGDLRRFKQVMETGEVVHSDASIHRGMHPAQPPENLANIGLAPSSGGTSR